MPQCAEELLQRRYSVAVATAHRQRDASVQFDGGTAAVCHRPFMGKIMAALHRLPSLNCLLRQHVLCWPEVLAKGCATLRKDESTQPAVLPTEYKFFAARGGCDDPDVFGRGDRSRHDDVTASSSVPQRPRLRWAFLVSRTFHVDHSMVVPTLFL